METTEQKRIDATNHERQALAASQGWGFSPDAPELLERWPFRPFTEVGDKRLAFGVVSGTLGGLSFTAFDYHRRPQVIHIANRFNTKTTPEDTIYIGTLWVLTMPASLPWFQIFDPSEEVYERIESTQPQTADRKVNRSYRLVNTDPQLAVQVLTPQVTALMKQHKLYNWTAYGTELVCVKHPILGRVKPDELTAKVTALGQLMAALPPHLWQQTGAQDQAPQPYPAQPAYHPQYPPPPQPQYPPQHQPQYPPPPGYPQQPYGHPGYPPPGYR